MFSPVDPELPLVLLLPLFPLLLLLPLFVLVPSLGDVGVTNNIIVDKILDVASVLGKFNLLIAVIVVDYSKTVPISGGGLKDSNLLANSARIDYELADASVPISALSTIPQSTVTYWLTLSSKNLLVDFFVPMIK